MCWTHGLSADHGGNSDDLVHECTQPTSPCAHDQAACIPCMVVPSLQFKGHYISYMNHSTFTGNQSYSNNSLFLYSPLRARSARYLGDTCLTCKPHYYRSESLGDSMCVECSYQCQSCQNESYCWKCLDGYYAMNMIEYHCQKCYELAVQCSHIQSVPIEQFQLEEIPAVV